MKPLKKLNKTELQDLNTLKQSLNNIVNTSKGKGFEEIVSLIIQYLSLLEDKKYSYFIELIEDQRKKDISLTLNLSQKSLEAIEYEASWLQKYLEKKRLLDRRLYILTESLLIITSVPWRSNDITSSYEIFKRLYDILFQIFKKNNLKDGDNYDVLKAFFKRYLEGKTDFIDGDEIPPYDLPCEHIKYNENNSERTSSIIDYLAEYNKLTGIEKESIWYYYYTLQEFRNLYIGDKFSPFFYPSGIVRRFTREEDIKKIKNSEYDKLKFYTTNRLVTFLEILNLKLEILIDEIILCHKAHKIDVYYDYSLSTLCFKDQIIPMRQNTTEDAVCRAIFSNPEKTFKKWEVEDIVEAIGEHEVDIKQKQKIRSACRRINDKMAKETTIKDLFIITKYTIQINPKYL
ncbi:MAG TPA: hypothetical protein PLL26_06020 [Candidatus Dojkabacteria bacterium]|nr:hypothetical protein [Candidatus Dojkabacteria bacterium]